MEFYFELNDKGMVTCKRLKNNFFDKVFYPYIFRADIMDFENVSNKYTYPVISMLDDENIIFWKWDDEK